MSFLSKGQYDVLKKNPSFPPTLTYEEMLDSWTSTQRPAVAFGVGHRPGFSTYPQPGLFDQLYDEVTQHGGPAWASSEGTNMIPGQGIGSTGFGMEAYLARAFNHGAALVNVYGWDIGEPNSSNPFRTVAEGDEVVAAYHKFLAQ